MTTLFKVTRQSSGMFAVIDTANGDTVALHPDVESAERVAANSSAERLARYDALAKTILDECQFQAGVDTYMRQPICGCCLRDRRYG